MQSEDVKSAVNIIQELIAAHTTRVEAVERLKLNTALTYINHNITLSKNCIKQLMDELSNYGDAVQSYTDRDNDYQVMWNSNLNNVNEINSEDSKALFTMMEKELICMYDHLLQTNTTFSETLKQIFINQKQIILNNTTF